MSCGVCEEEPIHSSNNQHFFKIILEETLKEKSLLIPKKFARIYGETLSDDVHIKIPCGSQWKMELTKREGDLWLTKGWPEFAKHYSIVPGHMLVFRYQGNSKFHVIIFDKTAVEIAYPTVNLDERDIVVIDDSIEILDEINPLEQVRTSTEFKTKGQSELHLSQKNLLDIDEKMSGIKRATGFNSDLPNFKVVMHPSYVCSGRLILPTSFAKQYLKRKSGGATLRVRGRTRMNWSIKYISNRLCYGWKNFVRDNNLKVGDACVFVLLDDNKVFFEVEICRASNEPLADKEVPLVNDSDDGMEIETCEVNLEARIHEPAHFLYDKPFFKVIMKPSCVGKSSHLFVPLHFAKRYIRNNEKVVLWDPNNRPWTVLFKISRRTSKFYSDWKLFVEGNDLKVGDVCIFELIDGTEVSFKVSILRIRSDQDSGNCGGNLPVERAKRPKTRWYKFGKKKRKCITTLEKDRALERAHFESEKPFFKVIMQPSYVDGCCFVPIPTGFAKDYIKNEFEDVVLCVGKSTTTWLVKLRQRCLGDGRVATEFSYGWKQFVNSNYLTLGDVCVFELINETDISFRVSIFRRFKI